MCCRSFVDCARHRRRPSGLKFEFPGAGFGAQFGLFEFRGFRRSGLSQRLGVDDVFMEIQWSGSCGSCCN